MAGCQTAKTNNSQYRNDDSRIDVVEQAFLDSKVVIIFNDLSPSFWHEKPLKESMHFDCFLDDKTGVLTHNCINKFSIYDSYGHKWNQTIKYDRLRIGDWNKNFTPEFSYNGSVLLIDKYNIEITTVGGKVYKKEIYPYKINKNIPIQAEYIYSNEYSGKVTDKYIKALNRPIITSGSLGGSEFEITFTINDKRVMNASVEFFDGNKERIGWSSLFYNEFSEQTVPFLNNGNRMNIDGKENILKLRRDDYYLIDKREVREIRKIIIYVYDYSNPDTYNSKVDKVILSCNSEMNDLTEINDSKDPVDKQ
jgi:hypothetical protein